MRWTGIPLQRTARGCGWSCHDVCRSAAGFGPLSSRVTFPAKLEPSHRKLSRDEPRPLDSSLMPVADKAEVMQLAAAHALRGMAALDAHLQTLPPGVLDVAEIESLRAVAKYADGFQTTAK
jgi:hypothetical protein